jgi:hypothetical protein
MCRFGVARVFVEDSAEEGGEGRQAGADDADGDFGVPVGDESC